MINNGTKGVQGMLSPKEVVVTTLTEGNVSKQFVVVSGESSLAVFEQKPDKLEFRQVIRNDTAGTNNLFSPASMLVSNGKLLVSTQGTDKIPGGLVEFDESKLQNQIPSQLVARFKNISELSVITGGEKDILSIVEAPKVAVTNIRSGGGDDLVVIQDVGQQKANIVVDLGDGDDKAQLRATGGVIGNNTKVGIHGGKGNDEINVQLLGPGVTATVTGGEGDDRFRALGTKIDIASSVLVYGDDLTTGSATPGTNTLDFDGQGKQVIKQVINNSDIWNVVGQGTVTMSDIATKQAITGPVIKFTKESYEIQEGDSLSIEVTVEPSGLPVHWDHDGNGNFGERSDLVGNPLPLSWRQLRNLGLGDDGTFQIGARVTNEAGLSTYVYQTLVIKTTPIVKPIANEEILVGELVQVPFSFVDFGDDSVKEWLVNWGDGNATRTHAAKPELTHVYKDNSEYTIGITAMDADGLATKVYVTVQNGTVGAATVTAPEAGTLDFVAEGSDIVVKTETDELFRILATEIQRLNIVGTPGDDTFNLGKLGAIFAGLVYFEAGAGKDTLRLTGSGQALDLTSIAQALRGIETIDIIGGGNNSLKLDFSAVLALAESTQTLRVRHDASSIIEFGNGWITEKPKILDNQFVHVLRQNNAKIEIVNSRPYHNPLLPLDVTANGIVDPIDVLVVINLLNSGSRSELSSDGPLSSEELAAFQYYDANGDGNISPLDVLSIINLLNRDGNAEGEFVGNAEGEFVANPDVAITSFTQAQIYAGAMQFVHDKDKLQGGRVNDLLMEGTPENQDDLVSLDAALADWSGNDWSLALVDLGGAIDDDDKDDVWGDKGIDIDLWLDQ